MTKQNNRIPDLFITGTDTGAGKTVLSLLLMQYLYSKGADPFYLKPFQTGCKNSYDTDSDARFIYSHVSQLKGKDPAGSVIYCYRNPKAPFFAARDQGETIDLKVVEKEIIEKRLSYNPLIIEGSGGLFVPVAENSMVIDVIKMTHASTIVAARAGMGTINHTLLTIEALNRRKIEIAGIVLLDSGNKLTSQTMIGENIEALETVTGGTVAGIIGRIDDFSKPAADWYEPVEKIVENLQATHKAAYY